jgi:hypothetical protein
MKLKSFSKWLSAGVAAIAMSVSMSASAVPFTITGGGFTTGSGYGTSNGQLDAVFESLVTPQSFSLNEGQTQSILFGRVTLRESCINTGNFIADILIGCGIGGNERDNLGVTANLTFSDPIAATVMNVALVGALAGPVNSNLFSITDFFINFTPVVVAFGNAGSFIVDMGDLFFNQTGAITNGANVTLKRAPIPEPASLALLGIGLIGFAASRRKSKSTQA